MYILIHVNKQDIHLRIKPMLSYKEAAKRSIYTH